MSAYPPGPGAATLADFIERAESEFGCVLKPLGGAIRIGPRSFNPKRLDRPLEGESKTLHVLLPNISMDTELTAGVLRNLVDRLGIPREAFGVKLTGTRVWIELGYEGEDEEDPQP